MHIILFHRMILHITELYLLVVHSFVCHCTVSHSIAALTRRLYLARHPSLFYVILMTIIPSKLEVAPLYAKSWTGLGDGYPLEGYDY